MYHHGMSGQPCGTDEDATDEDATDEEVLIIMMTMMMMPMLMMMISKGLIIIILHISRQHQNLARL